MGFGDYNIQQGNGRKEKLGEVKHGVRKDQLDSKYQALFDAYDTNKDGTLETEELDGIFKGLQSFAGSDRVLDANENALVKSIFAEQVNIQNVDFQGFVKSVSDASAAILSSSEKQTPDGGKEVTTTYNDGTVETISYYPDGEYKFKKLDSIKTTKTTYYTIGNNFDKKYTAQQIENAVKKAYNQSQKQKKNVDGKQIEVSYAGFKRNYLKQYNVNQGTNVNKSERHDFELSERGKQDLAVRDFVLTHYIETHQAAKEALESMGILDNAGALINTGAGELWNVIKNVWNGTEEEYQNFYELKDKFAPSFDKASSLKTSQEIAQQHQENYFKGEIGSIDTEKGITFQQKTEQYQNATILKDRIEILDKAILEINAYQDDVKLQKQVGRQAQGLNTENHIANAKALLLQYFGGDQKAVNMLVDNNQPEAVIETIKGIKADTDKQYQSVLAGKKYDDVKADYQNQYKSIYGTDFVPDELTDKVMDAKATGSFVKLAAITIVSILITRSPAMAQINGAIAGSAEATGAAANLMRTLIARYGQTAVAQGVKFAMTSGTLATDVGLTLLNQVTSERGFNGEELWESTKASAKFIYFGAYVGGPLAQAVSQRLGKIGVTAKMFKGGAKSANGAMQTTTIAGDKLMQNLVKGGNQILTKGGAFLTDVAAFTGLEVVTDGADLLAAGKEQLEFLPKLKIMNGIIEYVLGGRVHAGMVKAKMDAAIEQSGVKNWTIKEIKTPTKTMYEVEVAKGMPKARFANSNDLATAMLEAVAGKYEKLFNAAIGEDSKSDTSTKTEASPKPTSPQAAPHDKEVQGVRAEKSGKKVYEKPEIADIEDVLPADIAQYLKSVAKNSILKKAGITPDVADKMIIETSGTYDLLLPSTLKMIEHFENKLAKGEKITPDDIYNAIQKFDSYWADGGHGDKFQNLQRDLISKYWKNADKDFADNFNVAMTRTPVIMELRANVAKNSALKNGGITPDIATQMLRETSGTYGALVPRTLDMISYLQAKIESGAKLSSILVNEAFNKFNKEYTQAGYGDKFQNLQRDLISKYWKNAGENFGKIYDVAKNLDIDTPVQEIRTEYKNAFDAIDKNVRAMGLDKIGKMSIRLKGEQSLHDKIANYLIDHPGATVADAVKDVRDAIGARTVVESGDFKNHPEVKALLDAGKEREAMLRAAELQSEPAVDALKAEILKQAETGDAYSIARVSNYVAKDGIPYFSEAQLADLKQFAANHGVKLKINLRIDPSDPNFSKVDENYKPTTKSQPSGYTALQANFTTKDGKTIEWQFRGDKVNEFAEGEHIPYDLRTGKDIIGEHKELEVLYNPIKEMLSEKNMEKETYKEYNRYLGDYYTHLRKLELGFDSVEPKLEDYGKGFKFDERLNAKNLIALHEAADKIKNRVLSVKDAMEEYNSKISINRIEKFAGSVQPYTDFVVKNQEKIKELNKIQDMEEFCKQSFELIKNEMGLKDSGVKLAFAKGNEGGYYDLETNTVYVNVNWNGTKCVEGQGNKAEIFGDIAHELTHHIQWIEIMRNGWFEDDLGSAYKQQLLKSKEGKYIYNYASKIGSNNNSFETSMNQLWNWLNYKEPYKKGQKGFASDRNGNPIVDKNSLEYKEYKKQPVEKDAFEKGEAVVKKYKELID